MSLVLYKTCYNYAEAIVTANTLRAGGFNPTIGNYYCSSMMVVYVQAMGGMQIWLSEHEVEDADQWLAHISKNPINDYDAIPRRPFGRWFQVSSLFLMGLGGVPFLPLFFIAPLFLIFLTIAIGLVAAFTGSAFLYWVFLIVLPITLLLLHAKYVAGPKFIKEDNAHVA